MNPIELYKMAMGPRTWNLTSADTEQIYNNELYIPTSIGRGGIESKNEMSRANLEINIDISHILSQTLLSAYNEQVLSLTIFTIRPSQVDVTWKGRLSSQKPGDVSLTLNFESVFTSLRRPGVRARYQRSCRHVLYGRGCTLNPELFVTDATMTAINFTELTVPDAATFPDGAFIGGMIRMPDNVLSYIINHIGDKLTIQRVNSSILNALNGGDADVKLYPGCDHSRKTCEDVFDNLLNYGGFDWTPTINIMGGASLV